MCAGSCETSKSHVTQKFPHSSDGKICFRFYFYLSLLHRVCVAHVQNAAVYHDMNNRRSPASYALVCLPRWDNKENWMERRTGARVWKRLAEANVHSTWFKKALKSFISHRNLTNSLFHFSLFSAPAIESVFLRWNFHFHTFSFISS